MKMEKLFNKLFGYPCWSDYTEPGDRWQGLSAEKIEELYQAQHSTRFFRVLYYLESDLPTVVTVFFERIWDKTYWAFRHRFIQKEWMVDTKLDRTKYHESDTVLVASIFEQLVDFIEVCKPAWSLGDREANECATIIDHKTGKRDEAYYNDYMSMRADLMGAYRYWKTRDDLEKRIDEIYDEIPHEDTKGHSLFYPITEECLKRVDREPYYERIAEIEKERSFFDEKYMVAIIKHRDRLWN